MDPDLYRVCLDLDPYQSSDWIRISNKFFQVLDPDPFQNYTDPPHNLPFSISYSTHTVTQSTIHRPKMRNKIFILSALSIFAGSGTIIPYPSGSGSATLP